MSRKTTVSDAQLRVLLPSEVFQKFLELKEKLLSFSEAFSNLEVSQDEIDSLFPSKKGYQLRWEGKDKIYLTPISLEELRKKAKELGVDISDLGRKKKEILNRIRVKEKTLSKKVDKLDIQPISKIPKLD
jgi:hypothetical protein